jgi:hypothetical protein
MLGRCPARLRTRGFCAVPVFLVERAGVFLAGVRRVLPDFFVRVDLPWPVVDFDLRDDGPDPVDFDLDRLVRLVFPLPDEDVLVRRVLVGLRLVPLLRDVPVFLVSDVFFEVERRDVDFFFDVERPPLAACFFVI